MEAATHKTENGVLTNELAEQVKTAIEEQAQPVIAREARKALKEQAEPIAAAEAKKAVKAHADPLIEAQAKKAVEAHAKEVVKGKTAVLEAQAHVTQADAKKREVEAGTPDKAIVRIGVVLLGLIVLAVVGGVLALAFHDSALNAPESLIAIGAGALGALAGILTPAVRK